ATSAASWGTRAASAAAACHPGGSFLFGQFFLVLVMSQDQEHHGREQDDYDQHHPVSAEERLRCLGRARSLVVFFVFVYHVLTSDRLHACAKRAQNNPCSGPMSQTGVDCAMKAEVSRFRPAETAKKCCWAGAEVLDRKGVLCGPVAAQWGRIGPAH